MIWAFIIFGAFAVLTIGRVIWEAVTKHPEPAMTAREESDWLRTIK